MVLSCIGTLINKVAVLPKVNITPKQKQTYPW
jgi:hypothetical protein